MSTKHGMYGTPTYRSWAAMHARCKGRGSKPAYYVAKGVSVCPQWATFEGFLSDMGERPSGMTLDRYPDIHGNYEPGNCRWATKSEQSVNRSNTRLIDWRGESCCVLEWSRRVGVSETTIRRRLKKGWPISEVLSSEDFHSRSGRWAHGPNPQGRKP